MSLARNHDLRETVADALGVDKVTVLSTDEDIRAAEREQWDDGTNYLAVAPGVIAGYERNVATNTMLRKHGIEVVTIAGSEDASGRFVWPGFGENIRVLKWIIERLSGRAKAVATPIGYLPAPGSLDLGGLEVSRADLALLLTVDREAWKLEAEHIPEYFQTFHRHLPARLRELHEELTERLG